MTSLPKSSTTTPSVSSERTRTRSPTAMADGGAGCSGAAGAVRVIPRSGAHFIDRAAEQLALTAGDPAGAGALAAVGCAPLQLG